MFMPAAVRECLVPLYVFSGHLIRGNPHCHCWHFWLPSPSKLLWLKQNAFWDTKSSMWGLLSAVVIFVTWQTPLLESVKSRVQLLEWWVWLYLYTHSMCWYGETTLDEPQKNTAWMSGFSQVMLPNNCSPCTSSYLIGIGKQWSGMNLRQTSERLSANQATWLNRGWVTWFF